MDITRDVRNWKQNVFSADPTSATSTGSAVAVPPRFLNVSGLEEVDEMIALSLRLTDMRIKRIFPDGALPPLDETDPIVQNLTGRARALMVLAQRKVGVT